MLASQEPSDHLSNRTKPSNSADLTGWLKCEAILKASIGLFLNGEHFELLRDVDTAYDMWVAMENIVQRRTLLDLQNARQRYRSLKMPYDKQVFPNINRAKQSFADQRAMDATRTNQDLEITVLCGFPSRYKLLTVAIAAVADEEKLTLVFVKSRIIQGEQRVIERSDLFDKQPALALIGRTDVRNSIRQVPVCSHYKRRGHPEFNSWQKYPHLKPDNKSFVAAASIFCDRTETSLDEDNFVCLLAEKINHVCCESLILAPFSTCPVNKNCL